MKEKFEKIEKFYDYGSLIGLAAIAFSAPYLKDSLTYESISQIFMTIFALGIFYFIFSFMFAGAAYGLKKINFKFTLNPVKLIIQLIKVGLLCQIYSLLYFFIFIYYLIMLTIEKYRKREVF